MDKKRIIGLDAGSQTTGIILLAENQIRHGWNIPNSEVVEFVYQQSLECESLTVIIEDVRPYSMRITDGIIQTIKFIGQLEWRLKTMDQPFELIPRWHVKQWVFLQFKGLCIPEIEKKITMASKRAEKLGKKPRKAIPTFVYVDDRIVANAMRKWWNIKNPSRVGERAAYGLKDHSWQALGLVSYYMASNGLKKGN
jgi:hypothetical protein